jgi:undecaprenyl-diphosphatase
MNDDAIEDLGPVIGHPPADAESAWSVAGIARRVVVVTLASAFVVELLLHAKQSESAAAIVGRASPLWVLACLASSTTTYAMASVCTMGSTHLTLPFRGTFVMQVASSFVNRLVPGGVGGTVVNVRFLERAGAERAGAVASNALNNAAGFVVHAVVLLAVLPFFGGAGRDIDPPENSGLLLGIFAVLVFVGAVAWIRWIPRHWKAQLVAARRAAAMTLSSPRRVVALLGGSFGITAAHIIGLWCALHSVGAHTPLVDIAVVYLVGAAAASLSPTPGGLGAIEVALVTGLTQTATPAATAAAAVIVYRAISFWLPIAPGFAAYRSMRRRGEL